MTRIISAKGCRLLISAVIGAALTACATELQVGHLSEQWPDYPASSVAYSLPEKIFTISSSTLVTSCVDSPDGEIIHGITSVTVTTDVEVDPGQRYYIYFDSGSHSKNLDYVVQNYDNGTLKSISASIKDQVAPTTAAVLGSLVKLAGIALPLGAGMGSPNALPIVSNCKALNAVIAHGGSNAKTADARLTLAQIDRWTPALDDTSNSVQVALDALQNNFQLARPRWWRDSGNAAVELTPLNGQLLGDAPDGIGDSRANPQACADKATAADSQIDTGIDSNHAMRGRSCKPPLARGLVLRNGVRASLKVFACDANCVNAPPSAQLSLKTLSTETIPQFGRRMLVRVHSGYAQDSSIAVELNADGMISKLELTSVSALGDNATAMGNNATAFGSLISSEATATTTRNQNLANCLAAQKLVQASGGIAVGSCH